MDFMVTDIRFEQGWIRGMMVDVRGAYCLSCLSSLFLYKVSFDRLFCNKITLTHRILSCFILSCINSSLMSTTCCSEIIFGPVFISITYHEIMHCSLITKTSCHHICMVVRYCYICWRCSCFLSLLFCSCVSCLLLVIGRGGGGEGGVVSQMMQVMLLMLMLLMLLPVVARSFLCC